MQRRPTAQTPMPLKRSSACSLRSGTAAQRASGRGRRTTAEAGGASGSRPAASVKGTAAGGEGWAGAGAGAELMSGTAGQSAPAAGGLRRARLHGGSSSVSGGISATDAGTRTAAAAASASLRCVASSTLRSSRSRACAMPKSFVKRAPSAVAASALPAARRSARVRGELGRRALRPASSTVTPSSAACAAFTSRVRGPKLQTCASFCQRALRAGITAHAASHTGSHPSACRVTVQPLENTTTARFQKRKRRRSASGKPC